MKTHYLIARIIVLIIISGCSSSKRFDFKTAYKFGHFKYSKHIPSSNGSKDELMASLNSEHLVIPPKEPSELSSAPQSWLKQDLSRAELKEIRKELKQEIKSISSEIRTMRKAKKLAPEEEQAKFESGITEKKVERDAAKGLNQKIFLGILIGAAGLVLIIVDVLPPVGGIALVVGLVLIVWGFIEKGSF